MAGGQLRGQLIHGLFETTSMRFCRARILNANAALNGVPDVRQKEVFRSDGISLPTPVPMIMDLFWLALGLMTADWPLLDLGWTTSF